jgi:hypothetical protein
MSDLDPLFSKSCYENRDAPTPATVMAGLVPAIRSESLPRLVAGTCPAMTVGQYAAGGASDFGF